jgi:catechol 2,3-dioxygenase-like lactoylglutathione lyase family enzyme
MWGKPPFIIPDGYGIDVRNLAAAREWYREKLGLRETKTEREDDSGRPFADLGLSSDGPFLTLVEMEPGASPGGQHAILFARDLEKSRQWLQGRGVTVEAVATDSGGNRFFRFQDSDGNNIEVCVEPG